MRLSRLSIVLSFLVPLVAGAQFGPQFQFLCENPRTVALQDIDGDGDLDLMVGYRQGLSVYLNQDGQGQFSTATIVTPLETVGCMMDADGDGRPDLIGSRELGGGIYSYHNNGDGTFADGQLIIANTSANELHSTDLDGDGDEDLYYATDDGRLAISYNANAVGGFSPPIILAALPGLAYVHAVDVDGDVDPDLIYSSSSVDEVHLCANILGTFDTPVTLSIAGHGTVQDLDNDGRVDLLLASTADNTVLWQRNTGDGGIFGSPQVLDAAFTAPGMVDVSDLDGDGDLDAIVSSDATDEVAWFENTDGQGSFGPRQSLAFDLAGVHSFTCGDVDNDGDADLFAASTDYNKVVWYTNLANADGRITGRVFDDLNGDGIFNGNDHGMMNVRVEASDVGATYTNASGMYWFDVVPSNYNVWLPPPAGWTLTTPGSYSLVVPGTGAAQYNDFGLHADGVNSVLVPALTSSPLRCGEPISYWATVTNTGNQVSDVHLTLTLDPLSTFVWSDPQPTSIVDGVPSWDLTAVQPTHQRQIHLAVQLPGSEHVGQVLHDQLVAVASADGATLSTHTFDYMPTLLCAIDPNDKVVDPAGAGPEHLTPMDQVLTYTIRFQNTGNIAATEVVIVDTLDAHLDLSTLQVLGSSHAHYDLLKPNGVVVFDFKNIHLPDSATELLGSQGYVRFSIAPLPGLPEGSVVRNAAEIYFDHNDPVLTNRTMNTYSVSQVGITELSMTDGVSVYPNPAQGATTVRLGDDLQGRITLSLLDATGREVRNIVRRASTVVLDADGLPDGVYLLRATDERGRVRTARVAFQR